MYIEPLTYAYMARGAFEALKQAQAKDFRCTGLYKGELDYIDRVLKLAEVLEAETAEYGELTGVFAYDVAQPFGFEIGTKLLLHPKEPLRARVVARGLLDAAIA